MVDQATRLRVIARNIQLLCNSGHRFQFIRSVIQQGIMKYMYMVERSTLRKSDKANQPLYRPPDFRSAERIMNKYISGVTWFKRMDLGDKFRQNWKKRITTKDSMKLKPKKAWVNVKGNVKRDTTGQKHLLTRNEVTSALFVPPTEGGRLTELLNEEEESLGPEIGWNIKIVEKSGTPIVQLFKPRFDMVEGCVAGGECPICNNTGLGCNKKNVIYSME